MHVFSLLTSFYLLQTENGHHTDNNTRPRVSEWEVIQESGMKLKAVYGPGYTGIKNLGNSCYMGTVLQIDPLQHPRVPENVSFLSRLLFSKLLV